MESKREKHAVMSARGMSGNKEALGITKRARRERDYQ
jgi:hypothetical protein